MIIIPRISVKLYSLVRKGLYHHLLVWKRIKKIWKNIAIKDGMVESFSVNSDYKSFCVRDDIGSYIRTVYHMVSHTPKRGVGGSNPLGDGLQSVRKC